jgi:hypothetical protein
MISNRYERGDRFFPAGFPAATCSGEACGASVAGSVFALGKGRNSAIVEVDDEDIGTLSAIKLNRSVLY